MRSTTTSASSIMPAINAAHAHDNHHQQTDAHGRQGEPAHVVADVTDSEVHFVVMRCLRLIRRCRSLVGVKVTRLRLFGWPSSLDMVVSFFNKGLGQSSSMSGNSLPVPNSPVGFVGLGKPNTPETSGCGVVAVGP